MQARLTGSAGAGGGSAAALTLALDELATAVFLVGPARTIAHANAAGRLLLARGPAPCELGGRLGFRRRADDRAMAEAVGRALTQGSAERLRLEARTGEPEILLRLTPVPAEALVVVIVLVLRGPLLQEQGWSIAALGLSRHAAELAEALAEGAGLAEIAERTGIGIGALRTRLKKLLLRTGAHSQAALVSYLLRAGARRDRSRKIPTK